MRGMTWLLKLILSALLTSAICIASTFWVISTYVDLALEQYQLKSTVQSTPSWSQLMGKLTQQLSLAAGTSKMDSRSVAMGDKKNDPVSQPVTGPVTGGVSSNSDSHQTSESNTGSGGSGSPAAPSAKDSTSADKNPPEDAIAVFGHQSGSSAGSGGTGNAEPSDADKRVVVSSEEFTKKKEQLSNDDKNKIFNLMVTRVPQDEMQRISRLMEDGITASELKEIEQVMQKYLKPDEYTQLLGMIQTGS